MSELVAIVGPTASGKTAFGAAFAQRVGGEVVSADAFAVYRGLDIGTAKPEPALRQAVRHHLIDVADPAERYSAGMFVRDADAAIADIRARGKVPVVVGGTNFYVRALLFGLFPEPPKDAAVRDELERAWARDQNRLRERLTALDPVAAARIAANDRQRTLRALEVCLTSGRAMSELWLEHPRRHPRYPFRLLGIAPDRAELHARIGERVDRMFAAGLVEEVRGLLAGGLSPECHALKAIGYRESLRVLDGELTAAEAAAMAAAATRKLAKRQMTWLRGETGVQWLVGSGGESLEAAIGRGEARGGTGTGPV